MGGYLTPFRNGLLTSAATIVAIAGPSPAMAQTRTFNVPAQPASRGIPAFARQANIQILASGDVVRNRRTNAVRGSLTVEVGLRQLLAGTGLEASTDRGGTGIITVRERSGVVSPPSGEAQAGGAAADSGSVDDMQAGIAEILVIGSRSQNVDIRRTEDDPQPYVIFNSEEIERSQATNLEDFLRTRLSMNTQAAPENRAPNTGSESATNASRVNLRGLGAEQTLILVDGRRAPRVLGVQTGGENSIGDIFTQADINGIPLAAIERIEVLPSTAGGIYGGGAVGGVINIIRRRNYRGLVLQGRYDGTFRGGGESYRIDVVGGLSFNQGRTQVTFNGSHSRTNPLYVSDNDLWRRSRDRAIANQQVTTAYLGYVPNVIASATFSPVPAGRPGAQCFGPGGTAPCFLSVVPNLVLDIGTTLNSPITSVPIGYAGPGASGANDRGTALAGNAGILNSDLANDVDGRLSVIQSAPTVTSANVNLRQEIGNRLEAFLDLSGSRNYGRSYTGGLNGPLTIAGSAPNNPFIQTVMVYLPTPGVTSPVETTVNNLSVQAGMVARLGRNWGASVEYGWSRVETRAEYTTPTFNRSALIAALSTNPAMNPFKDVNSHPLDLSPYILEGPNVLSGDRITMQRIASARASGPTFALPGGPLNLTALLERREEKAPESVRTLGTTRIVSTPRSQAVNSAYAELRAPIFSAANAIPLIQALELQGSIRHDTYETQSISPTEYNATTSPEFIRRRNTVDSTDFTLAMRWQPVQDVAFRASYGTGFLPPNIGQLVSATGLSSPFSTYVDPQRGLTPVPVHTIFSGGNVGLSPETSSSISAGAVVTPRFLPGLRVSIDYTRIRRRGEIAQPPNQIAFLEQFFPGRVVRDTNPSSFGPYAVGPILSVDSTFVNLSRSELSAIDVQADYVAETPHFGELRFYVVATRSLAFRRQFTEEAPYVDSVDYSDGPLRWRGNGGIDWSNGGLSAGWNFQYFDSYYLYNSVATNPSLFIDPNGRARLPHQIYHDLTLRYSFGADSGRWARGFQITAGIQNVFDTRPPALATFFVRGGYSPYGDPRLRRFSISIRKEF